MCLFSPPDLPLYCWVEEGRRPGIYLGSCQLLGGLKALQLTRVHEAKL
jgi:hypothetical protein